MKKTFCSVMLQRYVEACFVRETSSQNREVFDIFSLSLVSLFLFRSLTRPHSIFPSLSFRAFGGFG